VTSNRKNNAAFSAIAKGAADRFFAVRLNVPRRGHLDASMRRGGFLAYHPEYHGDRRDSRGGAQSRWISSCLIRGCRAFVVIRKARHRSCCRRRRTFPAAPTAANHLTRAGTRIPIYGNDYSGLRGNSVARRRDELADRTVRGLKTRELEIKGSDGGVPIDGVVALSDLPKEIQSLNAECGQK
jgi:hypothetical protein